MGYPQGTAGAPGGVPGPRIRFDVIGEAWRLVQQQMSTWIIATLIVGVGIGVVYFVGLIAMTAVSAAIGIGGDRLGAGAMAGAALMNFVVMMAFTVLFWIAILVLTGGLIRMAIKQARGEPIAVGDIFTVTDSVVPLAITSLLVGVIVSIGSFLCIIPGILAAGLLQLAVPLAVDKRAWGMDAVRMSYETLKPELLMAVVFYFVLGVIAQLGAIACGFGMLVTAPIALVSLALLYRDMFDAPQTVAAPPPASPGVPPVA